MPNLSFFHSDETKVFHDQVDKLIKIDQCRDAHCFYQTLNYEISISKITQLIDSSESCHQEIWFSCYSAKLTKHAAWRDRNREIHEYFTDENTNKCECSRNNSCFSVLGTNNCNCDTGDIVKRHDIFKITNKVCRKVR